MNADASPTSASAPRLRHLARPRAANGWSTDGLGGYAMGTVAGLRTRRYHGLLVVAGNGASGAAPRPGRARPGRGLGDRRIRLATHEWADGTVAPRGHLLLRAVRPRSTGSRLAWYSATSSIERELAMVHGTSDGRGRPPARCRRRGPVRLELTPCAPGGTPTASATPGRPAVEPRPTASPSRRISRRGPGWRPGGAWYRGCTARGGGTRARRERGPVGRGRSTPSCTPVSARGRRPGPATSTTPCRPRRRRHRHARRRRRASRRRAGAAEDDRPLLALAADQFIVAHRRPDGRRRLPVVRRWSRDTMTSYEGLFLATGRADEGRALLCARGGDVSEGMLANTADTGAPDTTRRRHAVVPPRRRPPRRRAPATSTSRRGGPGLDDIIDRHVAGTRYGIRRRPGDGLLRQGADGVGTDVDGRPDRRRPVTPRAARPSTSTRCGSTAGGHRRPARPARRRDRGATRRSGPRPRSPRRFLRRDGHGLYDVVDGPHGRRRRDPAQPAARPVAAPRSAAGRPPVATCRRIC